MSGILKFVDLCSLSLCEVECYVIFQTKWYRFSALEEKEREEAGCGGDTSL